MSDKGDFCSALGHTSCLQAAPPQASLCHPALKGSVMISTYLAKRLGSVCERARAELPLQTLGVSHWYPPSAWKALRAKFGQVLVFVIHSQGIADFFELFPYL